MWNSLFLKLKSIFDRRLTETIIFSLLAIFNILFVFDNGFIVSLDGSQHIYNSQLLLDLLSNNEHATKYYELNDVVVGYWSAHALLSFFNLLFSASVAEKLLLLTIALGVPFAFLYFTRSLKVQSGLIIVLILPFAIHKYFVLGYYAFSLGWVFFFLTSGYFIRNYLNTNYKKILLIGLLLLLTFLTHMIVFALTVSFIGTFVLASILSTFKIREILARIKQAYRFLIYVAIAALPSIFLAVIYYRHAQAHALPVTEKSIATSFLNNGIFKLDFLLAYNHITERVCNVPLFYVFAFVFTLAILSFIISFIKKDKGLTPDVKAVAISSLLVASFFLFLYYFSSDFIGTGSIKFRLLTFVFFLIITFISLFKFKWYVQVGLVFFIIWYIFNIYTIRSPYYFDQNIQIQEVKIIEREMEENKTYFTINANLQWNNNHIAMYAGSDKSLVCLNNPQCFGQFPINYKWNSMPAMYAGTYFNLDLPSVGWYSAKVSESNVEIIDYFIVFGYHNFTHSDEYKESRDKLFEYYQLVTTGNRGIVALYKFNGINKIDSVYNSIINDTANYDFIKVKSILYNVSFENAAMFCAAEQFKGSVIQGYGIVHYVNSIKGSPEWVELAQQHANNKGISLEESILAEATYMYDRRCLNYKRDKKNEVNLDAYIKCILGSHEWKESVRQKALKFGVDFHQMVINDAQYMYDSYLQNANNND